MSIARASLATLSEGDAAVTEHRRKRRGLTREQEQERFSAPKGFEESLRRVLAGGMDNGDHDRKADDGKAVL